MNDIKTAAQALVDKLDEISTLINNINVRKENLHNPIDFRGEVKTLKTALERNKAIDELVKHDQEIGLYDEWGEPFYGSGEIDDYVDASVFDMWYSRGEWKVIGNCFGASTSLIYRLPANHKFYETALFKNAEKPGANHPCRGGE